MNIKQGILITITGTSLLMNGGCAAVLLGGAAAGGAGTILYEKGKLHSTEDTSLDMTWDATQAVINDMGFIVTSYKKDAVSAKLVALTTDKKRIQIILDKIADNLTRIEIRVGTFGDESLSRLILENIRKRLGFFSYAFTFS